jgi:type IV pilus assembly protein PilN
MIRVNLLAPGTDPAPRAWRRLLVVPQEQRAALMGLSMLMLTAAGAGGWWWSVAAEHKRVDREIVAAEANLTRLHKEAALVEKAAAREKDLRERLALIDRLRATQRAPVMLLDTISRSMAEGLWLTELRQSGAAVTLEGRAVSFSALTDFIGRLQISGRFVRPIDIVNSNAEALADTVVVRFIIRGEVGPAVSMPAVGATAAPQITPPAPLVGAAGSGGH